MTRPLLPILAGFIGGILLEHSFQWITPTCATPDFFLLLLGYCLLAIGCYGASRRHIPRLPTFLLLSLALMTGMLRYAVSTQLPPNHIASLVEDDELVTIEGYLSQPPEHAEKKRYLYVMTTWVEKDATRYQTTGKLLITLTGNSLPTSGHKSLSYGDTLRTRLRLRIPQNFGDFDYREYLRRQGIYLIGSLRHDRYLLQLDAIQGNPLLRWIYRLRTRILRFLDTAQEQQDSDAESSSFLPPADQAIQVIKAMTLGEKRALSPSVRDTFRNAGMYHFLVVSGIHIGIIAWVAHYLLHWLGVPLRYRIGGLALVILAYAGLTGFHFPVLRATIMALTLYASLTCNRIPDPLYSLAFTAAVILFLFPVSLFEVSFQLTVAATASILLLFRLFKEQSWLDRLSQLPWFLRIPAMSLIATSGAMIGVSPLMSYYFGGFYPYSFLSNPLSLPLISLLLPSSLLLNFVSLVFPYWDLLSPLISVNVVLTRGFIALASSFPQVDVAIPRPAPWSLLLYYSAVVGLFSWFHHKERTRRRAALQESQ
ncbi:DUF4131 domain-containing protein [candidate division KSB3 bacterium]|uniref:DUF4131 domain-containing protein n=1 Tax=candidate division KSB3 bacterium TaxID=2044937 RepID=A0A9D5Q3W6_9BACT|nr:DUF4131 domain-containing protein [candidate division KSB3 bacterium]MBD3323084.1 DUF4131 domain-containing protein [candidate division KSB3 bacterium]